MARSKGRNGVERCCQHYTESPGTAVGGFNLAHNARQCVCSNNTVKKCPPGSPVTSSSTLLAAGLCFFPRLPLQFLRSVHLVCSPWLSYTASVPAWCQKSTLAQQDKMGSPPLRTCSKSCLEMLVGGFWLQLQSCNDNRIPDYEYFP